MHRLSLVLILLLTLCLIMLGLVLPGFTTRIVDSAGADAVFSREMTTTESSQPAATQPLARGEDSIRKLSILNKSSLVPLSTAVASRTPEEMEALAQEALLVYVDNMLVESGLRLHPAALYLSVDPNDPDQHFMVWMMRFSNEGPSKEYHNLEFLMDDETGAILDVHYTSSTENTELEGRLVRLTQLYFDGLGIDADGLHSYFEEYGKGNNFVQEYYTLPMENGLETQICFVVDYYYMQTSFSHYRVDVVEP